MYKRLLMLICDDCGEPFKFARFSEMNRAPSEIDLLCLPDMATGKPYFWIRQEANDWRHYCIDGSAESLD